ncbi:hypothetical protein [Symbioplanes lichenis]|uniref:hypothetical protein n=1 Tax=Symbioplanes lichenis TaxID=1629072 RepID=UPI002739100F|nr:hypothetical protein [Actinoplanes lichenis]
MKIISIVSTIAKMIMASFLAGFALGMLAFCVQPFPGTPAPEPSQSAIGTLLGGAARERPFEA